MIQQKVRKSAGFTLVELLLVVGLLALSLGVTTDILLTLIRSYNKTQVSHEIEQQANFVTLKIEKELRDANAAIIDDADSDGQFDDLVITNSNNDTITYVINDTNPDYTFIERTDDIGTQPLTQGSTLSGITLSCPDSNFDADADPDPCFIQVKDTPSIIYFAFLFEKANTGGLTPFTAELEVSNTVVIRNTYAPN